MNAARLQHLLELHFGGGMEETERLEMEAQLREHPEARTAYWEAAGWHALFRHWGEETTGRLAAEKMLQAVDPPASPAPPVVRQHRRLSIITLATLGAAAAVILLLGPLWFAPPVATVVQESDAVWSPAALVPEPGTGMKRGTFILEKGTAVVSFSQGASLVLEGPARIRIDRANRVELQQGRLRARVPTQAHGFTVITPNFTVVDLGTEFGCQLLSDGSGEVHVMEGSVEVRPRHSQFTPKTLQVHQALRIRNEGTDSIASEPAKFLGQEQFTLEKRTRQEAQFAAWRTASSGLAADASTLLHLDFETGSDTRLMNRANPVHAGAEAIIQGCRWTQGRWTGKGGLEFNSPEDRLRISVNGTYPAMTLITWIKPTDLTSRQHLLAPSGDYHPGEVDWIINTDGTWGIGVHLSTAGDPTRNWRVTLAPAGLSPGRWHMLAAVLDTPSRKASLFLDGVLVTEGFLEGRTPLSLGSLEIGNSERHRKLRPNFRGHMDELSVQNKVLSAEEIRRLYEVGHP
ncbi:LamG-like jellyroll fold domain-containing protein [Verrucomicrobium sp. BvORR034]|uniref:LamG-like jellyroll fold domain-containing protein n=1 Tax=Verrucomicrobium sp. BvORR034 TaxID=1396418 RepID=UPI0006790265|nr:LamG-like jellyroll fold domain-containing protein [Verrucomicrobium sp. BvORR034]